MLGATSLHDHAMYLVCHDVLSLVERLSADGVVQQITYSFSCFRFYLLFYLFILFLM